jgi:hypothetical protein
MIEGLKLSHKSIMLVLKKGSRAADQHACFKQVAMDKLDLNKTRVFLTVAKEYKTGGGQLHRC